MKRPNYTTDILKLNGANRVGRHHELGVLCPGLQLKRIIARCNGNGLILWLTRESNDFGISRNGDAIYCDAKLTGQGIHEFQIFLSCLAITNHTRSTTQVQLLLGSAHRFNCQLRTYVPIATMIAEKVLRVIAGRELERRVIEVDEVGIPVVVTFLGEQRGIAGHFHDVAIAFDVAKVERLGECRLMSTRARSILTHIHLRSLTIVLVVVVLVMDEPTR